MSVVEYQSGSEVDPRQVKRGRILLRMAQFCAVAPMVIGVGIVFFYWLLDWESLVEAGILMLPVGTVVVVCGFGLAVAWGVNKWSMARKQKERMKWGGLILLVLVLGANFGVAFGCAWVGSDLASGPRMQVTIVNESGMVLDRVTVSASSFNEKHVAIPTGESRYSTFRPRWKKNVHVRLEQAGRVMETDMAITPEMETHWWEFRVRAGPGLTVNTESTGGRGWGD